MIKQFRKEIHGREKAVGTREGGKLVRTAAMTAYLRRLKQVTALTLSEP